MSVIVKYGSAAAPVVTAALAAHSDAAFKVVAVVGGLLLGAMWRAGSLRGEGRSWAIVRGDLAVSGLIGGANAVLCLALVQGFDLSVMFAMAVAVIVGATGLRALPEIKAALISAARRKLLGDDVALINPNSPGIDDAMRQLRERDREGG